MAVVAIFFFGACAKEREPEPKVQLQYEITTVSPGILYVIARASDTMEEPLSFIRRDVDFLGYGKALVDALNQIGQQYEIKHVAPVVYSAWPGSTASFGITKALIVLVKSKE